MMRMKTTRGTGPALCPPFMSRRQSTAKRLQRGYSLAEMLVVVSIIGILTMITIPNFTAMYRASQLKNSLRQFATDLRGARQRAVAQNAIVRINFNDGAAPGRYTIAQTRNNGATWQRVGFPRALYQKVYFENVNFEDVIGSDKIPDILFRPDGTATVPAGTGEGKVLIKMDVEGIKNTYEVSVRTTGKVSTK
jgi:prepilin-type N-terminal cleavage/methylation domain-containing protein